VKADYHLGEVPVRTNLSAFLGKYKDIQRSVTKVLPTGAFSGVFNAAAATINGAQLEFLARPASFLDLNGSVGYLKTKYDRFDATSLSSSATGNKFAQAPEWTYNLSATFRHDLSFGQLQANISYAYLSEVTFTDTNIDSPNAFQKGYGLVDLGVDLKNLGGRPLTLGVWVKNATDEDYAVNISDQSKSLGFTSYIYGDPRTYGVSLRYDFGG
jgi:iron complex outermembrane receptor protein